MCTKCQNYVYFVKLRKWAKNSIFHLRMKVQKGSRREAEGKGEKRLGCLVVEKETEVGRKKVRRLRGIIFTQRPLRCITVTAGLSVSLSELHFSYIC